MSHLQELEEAFYGWSWDCDIELLLNKCNELSSFGSINTVIPNLGSGHRVEIELLEGKKVLCIEFLVVSHLRVTEVAHVVAGKVGEQAIRSNLFGNSQVTEDCFVNIEQVMVNNVGHVFIVRYAVDCGALSFDEASTGLRHQECSDDGDNASHWEFYY